MEIAGVEFGMMAGRKGDRLITVRILYQPADKRQYVEAAEALRDFGLVEGADFTAKWDDERMGNIWLRAGVFEKAVEALKGAELKGGEGFTAYKAKGGATST